MSANNPFKKGSSFLKKELFSNNHNNIVPDPPDFPSNTISQEDNSKEEDIIERLFCDSLTVQPSSIGKPATMNSDEAVAAASLLIDSEPGSLAMYEEAQPIPHNPLHPTRLSNTHQLLNSRYPLEINSPSTSSIHETFDLDDNNNNNNTSLFAVKGEARKIGKRSSHGSLPLVPPPPSNRSNDIDDEPLLSTAALNNLSPGRSKNYYSRRQRSFFFYLWYKFLQCLWHIRYMMLPSTISIVDRTIYLDGYTEPMFFSPNVIRNQKHNVFSLVPKVLYDQFKYFFNLFYLFVAFAQFIPPLKVGPLFTYVAPLTFVLTVTITKEAYDDYKRYLRDREMNSALYDCYNRTKSCVESIPARDLHVGDLVKLHTNQRVPCDMVLLKALETGTTFVRTDQLDGETDWKLRRAVSQTQAVTSEHELAMMDAWIVAERPRREIYDFVGNFYSNVGIPFTREEFGIKHSINHPTKETSSTLLLQPLTNVENRRFTADKTLGATSDQQRSGNVCSGVTLPSNLSRSQRSSLSSTLHYANIDMSPSSYLDWPTNGKNRATSSSTMSDDPSINAEPLTLDNVLWSSTVVTSGPIWGIVVYTGAETRSSMNTSSKRTKMGIFDNEVNTVSKTLFAILVFASAMLVSFKGLRGIWFIYFTRFILLLSSIIPISLRVNIDLARTYYSWVIGHDKKLSNTVVRNSSIPEELGRIDIILSDKTGTLTCNDMVFKKLHIGRICYGQYSVDEIREHLDSSLLPENQQHIDIRSSRRRLEVWEQLRRTMLGLAVCHTVTPVREEGSNRISFQASSPDEIALTTFASSVGLQLFEATEDHIELRRPDGTALHFNVLYRFPFSSETKRMGCIVQHVPGKGQICAPIAAESERILLFMKGAESALIPRLEPRGAHWLPEECDNFARTGLRTLVFAFKELTPEDLALFQIQYNNAVTSFQRRAEKVQDAVDNLAINMTLLGLTGVEDRLQQDVPQTLEALRHAGVRVWMLTGDKIETATCIAVSAGLKSRQHSLTVLAAKDFKSPAAAQEAIESFALGPSESILTVDGPFIELALKYFPETFIKAACESPGAICSRCSPTQKADIVRAIQTITNKRAAAVGDGGNDVSMIQAASCGIGIVGKEGRQASLAADYSVSEFRRIHRLLFWHGRLSYQRSAKLAQFVIHRGLTIATIQVIFSCLFYFIPMAIFQGWLTVGYATYYTMMPVFSLVLDRDLAEAVVFMFPELYGSLRRGRALSPKTLFAWLWTSVYQGAVIMLGAILLFEEEFNNIVSITFTSLILAELLNVALEVTRWHRLMIAAEICSVIIYFASIALLPNYFNHTFIATPMFWWKVGIITLVSWFPLYCLRMCMKFWQPTRDSKLTF